MKKLAILSLVLLFGLMTFGQSSTVADFEKNTEGYKLFLYQSVIRVLNKDKNPDFNMLIRNLDHLKFVSTPEKEDDPKSVFLKLDKGVQNEGFVEIMSYDDADSKCHVYEREKGGKSTWVATLLMGETAAAMEMEGSLDLAYIKALSSLNMERLEEMLPLKKDQKKEEKESVE
ncbi:MAG: DUF4252 domain-containing protein [Bacteroidia bacterium]